MRRSARAVLPTALLGALLAAPATGAGAAGSESLVGTYRLVSIDNRPGSAQHGTYRHLLISGGRTYSLDLPDGVQPAPGSTLRVYGAQRGSDVVVSRVQSAEPVHLHSDGHDHSHSVDGTTALPDAPTSFVNESTGTTTVLVILARWNATASSVTQASAGQVLFEQDHAWFDEASYGQLGLSGAVTPWLTISAPSGVACDEGMTSLESAAKSAALSAGYNASSYDRTMIFFPTVSDPECSGVAGWAYIDGDTSWINGVMDRRVTVHEQGHNYGLLHAHSYTCTASGVPVPMSNTCTSTDYGNPFDAMGSSSYVGHFSAPYKHELGWLTGRQVALGAGDSARLAPFESDGATMAATVTDGTAKYWIEYRRKIGFDAALPISATTGAALVHAVDPGIDDGAGLLDMTPDGNHLAAELAEGASWTTPGGSIISVSGADETGITVTNHGPPGDRTATVIASSLSPTAVTYPAATTVTGRLLAGTTPLVGRSLALYNRTRGTTTWHYVSTATTNSSGYATKATVPTAHKDYQWRFAGDADYLPSTSATRAVSSKIRLTAKLNRTSMPRGYTATMSGTIGPAHSGHYVYLQRYYSSAWRTVASWKLGSSTSFGATIKIGVSGTYVYRYYVKSQPTYTGATTSKVTLKVY